MSFKPIEPGSDSRVSSKYAVLNGNKHHYLLGIPDGGSFKATVFLIHGWPDISFGWRYQIPALLDLGLRVVCPDSIGYGSTEAPQVPPESLSLYSLKRASDNIAELAKQLGASKIIIGGHDWGGMIVWRAALWHPELISHIFSVCTPYAAPSKEFFSIDATVERLPMFGYQKQLAGSEVESAVKTKDQLRQFFNVIFGGRTPNGKNGFDPFHGFHFDLFPDTQKTPLLSEKELDYYVDEYARNGLHGTLNWYRTREVNYKEELALKDSTIHVPSLFIAAKRDSVLRPELSLGMDQYIRDLTRREVNGSHWVLWEQPVKVNEALQEWFQGVVLGSSSKL